MKKHLVFAFLSLFVLVTVQPAFAVDAFQITSRHLDVASNDEILTGYLAVDIMNTGDEAAGEIVISVPGLNKVTYDNRPILVGNLAPGEPKGLLEPIAVPVALSTLPLPEEPVTWHVEYTNAAGERVEIDVPQFVDPGDEVLPQ